MASNALAPPFSECFRARHAAQAIIVIYRHDSSKMSRIMEYLAAIKFHKEDLGSLATSLISILGALGIVTKLGLRRASLEHAELTGSRAATLLLGTTASVYFVLESLWLGWVNMSWASPLPAGRSTDADPS